MKNSLKLAAIGLVLFTSLAHAAAAKSNVSVASAQGSGRFGLGLATYGGTTTGTSPSVTAWWELNNLHALQFFAMIGPTTPSFGFGAGAAYKFTAVGDPSAGLHLGVGAQLGTNAGAATSTFFLNIAGNAGVHFSLGGHVNNIMLSFDAGPVLTVTPSPVNFMTTPFSTQLGASIIYFL